MLVTSDEDDLAGGTYSVLGNLPIVATVPVGRPGQPKPDHRAEVKAACRELDRYCRLARMKLPESARRLIASGSLAHLVTLNRNGSPQVTCVWVGLEGDELVSGHLRPDQRKLKNVACDPRVALSIEGCEVQPPGLKHYLVIHGRARLVEGGAPELLQRLAHVYLGPDVKFPPMENPPSGHVMRITVERIGGVGPWAA